MSNEKSINDRQSGIELLKIIAMFGIVISHCAQSVSIGENFITNNVDIEQPATSLSIFISQFLRSFGALGNDMFLLSSIWFLVDSKKVRSNKIAYMILDAYVFSVTIMLIFSGGVTLTAREIIKQLFPITFANNWYIPCYLLLYAIHPLLNTLIDNMTRKQHLAYCFAFFIMYMCIGCIKVGFFFGNNLIHFTGFYFIVSYLKKNNLNVISNFKTNIICLFTGISLSILLLMVMNFAGMHVDIAAKNILHFSVLNHNPINFLIAFSLFNIFRVSKLQSKIINYISSLTMLIYIIHENDLFRAYLRTDLLYDFWEISNKMNIVLLVLIFSAALFIASTVIAIVYNKIFQPLVHKIAEKVLQLVLKIYCKIETMILRLN